MATQLTLDPETELMIDDLIASGRFAERTDVLRHGVKLAHDEGAGDDGPLSPQVIAGIERGLADAAAGRVLSAEQVRSELERRHSSRL